MIINRAVQETFSVAFGQSGNANPLSVVFPGSNQIPLTVRINNSIEASVNFVVVFEDSEDGSSWADVSNGAFTAVPGGFVADTIVSRKYLRTKNAGSSGSGEIILVPAAFEIQLTRI